MQRDGAGRSAQAMRPICVGSTRRGQRLRRLRAAAVSSAVLLVLLVVPAGGQAQAETPPSSYTFSQQFSVGNTENQQGLAFAAGVHYVGFDVGNGNGRIVAYDAQGVEQSRTGPLPLGHAAEIDHRQADGLLYVATGGASAATKVSVVDLQQVPAAVVRTYDFTNRLGNNGMVAIDDTHDRMLVFSGPNGGPYVFSFVDLAGNIISSFTSLDHGVPQGLEVVGDQILLYTSLSHPTRNQITVLSSTGSVLRVIPVPVASEGEGLSVDPATNEVYIGVNAPNRVHKMSPAFVPEAPGSSRIVTLTAVADTMARQQAPTTTSGSATTLLTDVEETTGSATRATPYLRFTVPSLADGESISEANLSLQVTNGTSNGPTIWRTETSWAESTLTWNSGQPARLGSQPVGGFGSLATGRKSTPLSGITGGGDVSLQLYADGTDGLQFASRDGATTDAPRLVLTVSTVSSTETSVDSTPPPAPAVTPDSGTYSSAQSVSMTSAEDGATVRYTVGTGTTEPADPTASTGVAYTGPVSVASSQVIKAAAFDAMGNRSAITKRSYVIGTTRTLTLTAAADTTARQKAPTTASGSLTTLLVDTKESKASSRATAYLRFTVPALASGESVAAARLSLHANNATTNGPAIWRTGTDWSETGMTWNSGQPARSGTAAVGNFGTMPTGRVSTPVSGITTAGDVSFQLYAESNDDATLSAREGASLTQPQLVLTIRSG